MGVQCVHVVEETLMNLRQIFHASFKYQFLVQVAGACAAGISNNYLSILSFPEPITRDGI